MPRNRTTSDSRQPILQDAEISYSTSDALNELNIPALKRKLYKKNIYTYSFYFSCLFLVITS